MKRKFRNYIIFISLFISLSFILLELVLFLSGEYILYSRKRYKNKDGNIKIICVGDSHTFGVGTSKQYSYPMQLEKLLNYNNYSNGFTVINLGIPGASTKRQIEELESFFSNKTADIVLFLTGRNNLFDIEAFENISLHKKFFYSIRNLKSTRFLKELFSWIIDKKDTHPSKTTVMSSAYNDYLNFYLEEARNICFRKSVKLILLSYYNSFNEKVKEFAERYRLPYFDSTEDFKQLFKINDEKKYISPDASHMNSLGYKFFAEKLYENLFLNQAKFNFNIGPLLRKINDSSFYADKEEIEQNIKSQVLRIAQKSNTSEYPFELIHLGHIYIEIGDEDSANKFYMMGLTSSNYMDNNTIVSPIINLHLRKGQKGSALKICKEILSHNPENKIAQYYYSWIMSNIHK